jgi:hypothetical protein
MDSLLGGFGTGAIGSTMGISAITWTKWFEISLGKVEDIRNG